MVILLTLVFMCSSCSLTSWMWRLTYNQYILSDDHSIKSNADACLQEAFWIELTVTSSQVLWCTLLSRLGYHYLECDSVDCTPVTCMGLIIWHFVLVSSQSTEVKESGSVKKLFVKFLSNLGCLFVQQFVVSNQNWLDSCIVCATSPPQHRSNINGLVFAQCDQFL